MGLGKTFTGAEKLKQLDAEVSLVICQKSKIEDWLNHFTTYYEGKIFDLTNKKQYTLFCSETLSYSSAKADTLYPKNKPRIIGIINYELAFRRKELLQLNEITLMLDESSMIQNETAKRSKFILKLKAKNIILLSGTPVAGKYEKLWSQLHLLGWKISKDLFWKQYVVVDYLNNQGFPIKIVRGYKNVDRLKEKMREYGCRFLKTEDVFDLPQQIFNTISVSTTKEYKNFKKSRIVDIGDKTLVGDTTLTKMLYERMLCGSYNKEKLAALEDIMNSTEDRLIIFYNFNDEFEKIKLLCEELNKPYSIVSGSGRDLSNYESCENSVTLIQYQAGAMGLNLQKANKTVYFTPTLSSELFEQSKKRTHRLKQEKPCFYYELICKNSIEEKIYKTLEMRRDYTNQLFEEDSN